MDGVWCRKGASFPSGLRTQQLHIRPPPAMAIMVYALITFHWRATAIRNKGSGPYDDRLGV